MSDRTRTSCISCRRGYTASKNFGECRRSNSSQYQDEVGASSCKNCPPGSGSPYIATSIEKCLSCRPGKYPFAVGATGIFCRYCGRGSIVRPDEIKCTKCPLGSTHNTRATACVPCPPDTSGRIPGRCAPCNVGFFQNRQGQVTCKSCPPDSTFATKGASFCTPACVSPDGTSIVKQPCAACSPGTGRNEKTGKCETCPARSAMGVCSVTGCVQCQAGQKQSADGRFCTCKPGLTAARGTTGHSGCVDCDNVIFRSTSKGEKCFCPPTMHLDRNRCGCLVGMRGDGNRCVDVVRRRRRRIILIVSIAVAVGG